MSASFDAKMSAYCTISSVTSIRSCSVIVAVLVSVRSFICSGISFTVSAYLFRSSSSVSSASSFRVCSFKTCSVDRIPRVPLVFVAACLRSATISSASKSFPKQLLTPTVTGRFVGLYNLTLGCSSLGSKIIRGATTEASDQSFPLGSNNCGV